MLTSQTTYFHFQFRRWVTLIVSFCVVALLLTAVSSGQIQGLTEPYRSVALSSDESGAIFEMTAQEGKTFEEGDVLARLDNRVQEIQLEIATAMASANSSLVAAEQTLNKRTAILERLTQMNGSGHASESELIRARMELSIAHAKMLSANEEKAIRELEVKRARLQLERRTIRAPFDGIVSRVHRKEGEFVSPVNPEIVTYIQNNRLYATFAVPGNRIFELEVGKSFEIEIAGGTIVMGTVETIGVETDAQSGLVPVKLVIENADLQLRAGESCTLELG